MYSAENKSAGQRRILAQLIFLALYFRSVSICGRKLGLLPEPPSEFCGGDADDLGKNPGKVVGITETHPGGNFRNAVVGQQQAIFSLLHPYFVDVYINIDSGASLENSA